VLSLLVHPDLQFSYHVDKHTHIHTDRQTERERERERERSTNDIDYSHAGRLWTISSYFIHTYVAYLRSAVKQT